MELYWLCWQPWQFWISKITEVYNYNAVTSICHESACFSGHVFCFISYIMTYLYLYLCRSSLSVSVLEVLLPIDFNHSSSYFIFQSKCASSISNINSLVYDLIFILHFDLAHPEPVLWPGLLLCPLMLYVLDIWFFD